MRKPRGQTHIVNHLAFSDARPQIGSKDASFNPGAGKGPMPGGAPRYVQAKGVLRTKAVTSDPASTQKRY